MIKYSLKSIIMHIIELRVKRTNYFTMNLTAYETKKIFFSPLVKIGLVNTDWVIRRIYYFFRYNFYITDKKRKAIRLLYLKYFSPLNNNITFIHQYGVYNARHSTTSKALCFGIGEDIFFEEFLATKLNYKVLAGDPTPVSKKFMQDKLNIKNLNYVEKAIWTNNEVRKFYVADNFNSNETYDGDGSLTNYRNTSTFFEVQCHNLEYFMNKLKIDEIDILKMDIEGAAIEIIEDCLLKKLFPKQITGEIEIPAISFEKTILRLDNLLKDLSDKYIFFLFSQKIRFNKFEFLMVRKN